MRLEVNGVKNYYVLYLPLRWAQRFEKLEEKTGLKILIEKC